MISISYEEFMQLVALRQRESEIQEKDQESAVREKVLRPDQQIHMGERRQKQLASCPVCDALVDADILHPYSGLCPICHEESQLRNR